MAKNTPRRRFGVSILALLDVYFTRIWSFSLVGHAFLVALLLLTPIEPKSLEERLSSRSNRFDVFLLNPHVEPPKTKPAVRLRPGGRAKGPEGAIGRRDAKTPLKAAEGAPRVNPDADARNRRIVQDSGLLKVLTRGASAQVSSVLGPGFGSSLDAPLGRLTGRRTSDARGNHGLATRGLGQGGGGESLGIGTIGDGDGFGDGPGDDVELDGPPRTRFVPPPVRRINSSGCLSRETVSRHMSRVHSQARYCYEQRLSANPNLRGKVTTRFVIGPTGSVLSAKVVADSLGDPEVSACLLRAVERLRFPACGSGSAQVTYPWLFTTGS